MGDLETAGRAALTMIEELGEHLTNDDLSVTYRRATDLLAGSREQATLLRLSTAASRVLFLTGVSPVPPDWKDFSLTKAMRRYEKGIIQRALKDAGGIVTRAACLLGQKHNTLIRKLNAKYPDLLPQRTPAKRRKRSLIFIHDTIKRHAILSSCTLKTRRW